MGFLNNIFKFDEEKYREAMVRKFSHYKIDWLVDYMDNMVVRSPKRRMLYSIIMAIVLHKEVTESDRIKRKDDLKDLYATSPTRRLYQLMMDSFGGLSTNSEFSMDVFKTRQERYDFYRDMYNNRILEEERMAQENERANREDYATRVRGAYKQYYDFCRENLREERQRHNRYYSYGHQQEQPSKPKTTTVNAYVVLGCLSSDTIVVIKKAYRAKITQYHPDRYTLQEDKDRVSKEFLKIQKAYEVIKNLKGIK